MRFKNVKERVEHILRTQPEYRDDDYKLLQHIWTQDVRLMGLTDFHFLQLYGEGKMTNAESVRRSRAQLQQQNPELRGERYAERMGEQVDESLRELDYNVGDDNQFEMKL